MPPMEDSTSDTNELVAEASLNVKSSPRNSSHAIPLAQDLLRGAEEIAAFLFGSRSQRRKVYHLAETSRLPVFRLGSVLCARRSVLMTWIEDQEQRALRGTAGNGFTMVTNPTKE